MTEYVYQYFHKEQEAEAYRAFEKDYYKKEIIVKEAAGGLILPQRQSRNPHTWMGDGGVADAEDRFVELSGIPGFGANEGSLVFGGYYKPDRIEERNEDVLYMGAFQPHWGHFLLEYITRLWYWVKEKPDIKIAYCGFNCEPGGLDGNYLEILELLGIKKSGLIDIRTAARFRKVIVPQQSFLRFKYYSDEYRMLTDALVKAVQGKIRKKAYDKIYFTREKFAGSKERGEERVREAFQANGFRVLAPERLSAAEQIYYASSCKKLAVPIGGASMNAVFAKEGCELVMVKKCFPEPDGDIHVVSQACKAARVVFVDCYYKLFRCFPASAGGGPHVYGATKELQAFLVDHHMKQIKNDTRVAMAGHILWLSRMYVQYQAAAVKQKLSKTELYQMIKKALKKERH